MLAPRIIQEKGYEAETMSETKDKKKIDLPSAEKVQEEHRRHVSPVTLPAYAHRPVSPRYHPRGEPRRRYRHGAEQAHDHRLFPVALGRRRVVDMQDRRLRRR